MKSWILSYRPEPLPVFSDVWTRYSLKIKFIRLQLYTYRDIDDTSVYSMNITSWDEDEVKYNNMPSDTATTKVGSLTDILEGTWATFNLDVDSTILPTRVGKAASFGESRWRVVAKGYDGWLHHQTHQSITHLHAYTYKQA